MKNKSNSEVVFSTYLRWPLIFAGAMVIMDIVVLAAAPQAAVLLVFSAVFFIAAIILYLYSRKKIYSGLISFAKAYDTSEKRMIDEMPYPGAVCDTDGQILWRNKAFSAMLKAENQEASNILAIFPDISKEILSKLDETGLIHSTYGEKRYLVEMRPDVIEGEDANGQGKPIVVLYIQDETELLVLKNAYTESKNCEGLICIDNYDEAMAAIEEVRQSLLTALVDRRISNYINSMNGIVKKLEKDKYFFCIMEKDMNRMIEDRFSLLKEVKTINIGNDTALTLSIGVGRDGSGYAENYTFATGAMELALGRGGDQAVVKSGDDVSYFGGKTSAKEKSARVKARVKAQAFRDLLDTGDKLIVMGHRNGDPDSFGASIGFYRMAESLGKKAYIVLEKPSDSFELLFSQFTEENGYPKGMFITADQARDLVSRNSIVVVVDTNKANYTEAPELLNIARNIVVVDHHRMGADSIDNTVLSYIEPYASSAAELVTEIIQYIGKEVRLKPLEAEALYSGIVIDTQNFIVQTGIRTFEAAAYLKRMGADIVKIRKMLRDDISDYKARADVVNKAEIFKGQFALSVLDSNGLVAPTVVCAQAANSLLEINGIRAAFVFTDYNNQIFISARSIDDVNVQVIMEKLGGGGHKTVAGVQLKDISVEDSYIKIKEIIDEMIQEGEIE